jgi:hypothetical protein
MVTRTYCDAKDCTEVALFNTKVSFSYKQDDLWHVNEWDLCSKHGLEIQWLLRNKSPLELK